MVAVELEDPEICGNMDILHSTTSYSHMGLSGPFLGPTSSSSLESWALQGIGVQKTEVQTESLNRIILSN